MIIPACSMYMKVIYDSVSIPQVASLFLKFVFVSLALGWRRCLEMLGGRSTSAGAPTELIQPTNEGEGRGRRRGKGSLPWPCVDAALKEMYSNAERQPAIRY